MGKYTDDDVEALLLRLKALENQLKLTPVGKAAEPVPLTPQQERRYVLKDILNSNLLHPDARKVFEAEYAKNGAQLEKAAAKSAS